MKPNNALAMGLATSFITGCGPTGESSKPIQTQSSAQVESFTEQLNYPLKVKDVGLGVVRVPCTPKEETYVDILQKPVRIQLECTIGSARDSTDIVFSADGKSVVRVTRNQYLLPSDPEPDVVLKAAISFYGAPDEESEGNWMANYGNAYSISYVGQRANEDRNESGIGLLIKGFMCGDGNYGTARCGDLGTTLVKYDLIDIEGFKAQIEAGKEKLAVKNQEAAKSQKF